MKQFETKPWVLPQPVLIIGTYNTDGTPNAMNAAWGGQLEADEVIVSLGSHATTDNLARDASFTLSFATTRTEEAADYVGLVSGRKQPDKVTRAGWTARKAPHVNAPVFSELPFTLECRVKERLREDGGGFLLVGEIAGALCDEKCLNEAGLPDMEKMGLIVYNPIQKTYMQLGQTVGKAFSDGNRLK